MENRRKWQDMATDLLKEIGDSYTPPNTVTKLLNRFDYECFYKRDVVIGFYRTNRKRMIRFVNYGCKGDSCCDSSDDGFSNGFKR